MVERYGKEVCDALKYAYFFTPSCIWRLATFHQEDEQESFQEEGWEGTADVSDWEPFRVLGRSMIEYVAKYYREVESRPVRARVEPGYLKVRIAIKYPTAEVVDWRVFW